MKRKDLESLAKNHGWEFDHHGGDHEIWKKKGHRPIAVPRKREVREGTGKAISKRIRAGI